VPKFLKFVESFISEIWITLNLWPAQSTPTHHNNKGKKNKGGIKKKKRLNYYPSLKQKEKSNFLSYELSTVLYPEIMLWGQGVGQCNFGRDLCKF
jgi:hypothetical protein